LEDTKSGGLKKYPTSARFEDSSPPRELLQAEPLVFDWLLLIVR
jgi:hypothetical protein